MRLNYIMFIFAAGHANNSHCLAKAINSLAGALFTIHGPGDVDERLKELLAVSIGKALDFDKVFEKV